jgi:hypothetical protein
MRSLIKILLYLLPWLIMQVGCDNDPCLHGTGEEIVVSVSTGYFRNVEVYGIFDVILKEDTMSFVEFRGGEEVLKYVEAAVNDSLLRLYNNNSCFFLRSYKRIRATVHYQDIDKFIVKVTSHVSSDGPVSHINSIQVHGEMAEIDIELASDNFLFYNHTTVGGIFIFKGYCDHCNISNYYTANCDISGLSVHSFYVTNASLCDLYVNADEFLQVRILNKGNIYYSGSPEIVIDTISGSGRLLPWE